jgi:hypothetical protein
MERHFGRETVYLFHARPRTRNRYWPDWHDQETFTHVACRLTGRIKSGDRTAMSLWLGEPEPGPRVGVHVWNTGELTVERPPPWEKAGFAFPRQKPIRDEAIRPGDQSNELLVVVQNRKLSIFVNDKEIGQALELPAALFPAHLGIAAWHLGEGEARVRFLRYTLWDLDNPQWRGPHP